MQGPGGIKAGRAYVEIGVDPTYKRAVGDADRAIQSLGNRINSLNARLGQGGLLGQIGKLAVGGGAIAGVNLLTRALGQATDTAAQLANKLREGKIAAADIPAELVKSIPVLGGLSSAVENVLDIFTGIRSQTAAIYEDVKRQEERMKKIAEHAEKVATFRRTLADIDFRAGIDPNAPPELRSAAQQFVGGASEAAGALRGAFELTGFSDFASVAEARTRLASMRARADRIADFAAMNREAIQQLERRIREFDKLVGEAAPVALRRFVSALREIPDNLKPFMDRMRLEADARLPQFSEFPFVPGVSAADVEADVYRRFGNGDFGPRTGPGGIPFRLPDEVQAAATVVTNSSAGTFNSAAVQSLLGGASSAEERAARAAEELLAEVRRGKVLVFKP